MSTSINTGPAHPNNFPPKFAELTERVLFGDMWTRTQLKPRERSLATAASALGLLSELNASQNLRSNVFTVTWLRRWRVHRD